MQAAAIIARKRDGLPLSDAEIRWIVSYFTQGKVPDYQMSALAMAVYLRGMDERETATLTEAMLESGDVLEWGSGRPVVDKHSTGGVGDKVSLVLAPLLASAGLRVPMISGRGLGATGGTLDKLEAIPGFRCDLGESEIRHIVDELGCVICGATPRIAPADRKLYALRDVTATVASIPLITASIMSKKLAEGLDNLVLDVKTGSGAFMKTIGQARALARSLVETGQRMKVRTRALITDMSQPLGRMVGNALEVDEALDLLRGEGPSDVRRVTVELAAELLSQAGVANDVAEGRTTAKQLLADGQAYEKFERMVEAQGGDLSAPRARAANWYLESTSTGYLHEVDTEMLGRVVIELGGGRRLAGEAIDHAVGLEYLVRLGEPVDNGQPLLRVYGASSTEVTRLLESALRVTPDRPAVPELFLDRLTE